MTPQLPRRKQTITSQRGGIISKGIFLIFLVIVIGLIYVARHPLLRICGRIWIVDEDPVRSDAIVVLGDDNYNGDRAARAADLLKAGWAPRIVASGRFLRPYASIADLTEHDLKDRGVPVDAIVKVTHRAENTRDEIDVIRRLASEKQWHKLLIVTSNYHTRRTSFICGRMFPSDIGVRVIAAPDADYNPDTWWQSRLGLKLFLHELVGYVVAMWEVRRTEPASSSVIAPGIGFVSSSPKFRREYPFGSESPALRLHCPPACTIFQVRAWVRPFLGPGPQPSPGSRLNFLPVFPIVESWEA